MSDRKRKLALVFLTVFASLSALTILHGLLVHEPDRPTWLASLSPVERDLSEITRDGVLRVAVARDEVGFEVSDGEPHGLAVDLARRVARRLNVDFEMVPVANPAAGLRDVLRGRADVFAAIDSGPSSAVDEVAWTTAFEHAEPVVLGRDGARIRTVFDLRGKTIAVRRNTALEDVALKWQSLLDGQLRVDRLPPVLSVRELAAGAERGTWPLVVLDQDRARLERSHYEGLTISPALGERLPVRWAVRPNSPQLTRMTGKVLDDMRVLGLVASLERDYLENPNRLQNLRRTAPRPIVPEDDGRTLTPWDGLFRAAAHQNGLDWRILAAISFHESRHDPTAVGQSGSIGLMQLMPATAVEFGAEDPFDPQQNVAAAARHLRWLYGVLDEVAAEDRLAFALAAYNFGLAHLEDAQELAVQRNLDPTRWAGNVAEVLPSLEDPQVAATLPHGFARGRMTRYYVARVLEVYDRYSGQLPTQTASRVN